MRESVLTFGPTDELVGIVTTPQGVERGADAPAVVILNSGIIHRVGPNRLHVQLARHLAGSGHAVLRLDQSGVGDSRPLGTRKSPELEALQSVEAGLDELQAIGVADRFVLVGLCSGANHSAQVAARDRRVVGAVLIDPPGLPPTFAHHVRRVVRASLRPRVLLRLLRGRYGLLRVAANRLFESGGDDPAWEMNRAGIVKILRTLVERDTRLLFVVTDSLSHVYSYPDQLFDIFPEVDLRRIVRSVLLPGAEHTFPRASDRDRLEREVEGWLRDQTFRGDADGAEAEPREGLGSR